MKKQKSLVVLQARFNSSRLPGKVLFPINGIPLLILAARRAANTGRPVVIATSDQSTDDEIYLCAQQYGIHCIRGALEDTLSRFVLTIQDLPAEALIFRLTADNVLPDGQLLDAMEQQYLQQQAEYMACDSEKSKVPYGISAELMRAYHLRDAHKQTTSEYDREHVTPYIRKHYAVKYYQPECNLGPQNFRCTIDTLYDYFAVKKIFIGINDMINARIEHIINNAMSILPSSAVKPMTLGGAQFGMTYGIANMVGKPTANDVKGIINYALSAGIKYIDTAFEYGDSESIIGQTIKNTPPECVHIITKTSTFSELAVCTDPHTFRYATRSSIYKSCTNLNRQKLDVVMMHRAEQLVLCHGAIYNELINLKKQGVIDKIGISVQSADELEQSLHYQEIEAIQLPFNILDNRWNDLIPVIKKVKAQRNLIIFARSSLLQGLLQSDNKSFWIRAHVLNYKNIHTWLNEMRIHLKKETITDLCINYANSQSWIDSVVLGVDDLAQLHNNLNAVTMPPLSAEQLLLIESTKPTVSNETLNPAMWKKS